MAFGLFRKRVPEATAPAVELKVPAVVAATDAPAPESDSAKEILELLELELGGMIRQLERAANSVAGGAEATAATLTTIRQRTDALTGRTTAAQSTATTFSQAADKFTHSAQGIGDAGARRRQARRPGQRGRPRSQRQCGPVARIVRGDRQCRQSDRADRAANHAAGAQLHHRGRARRRSRTRFCRRRHRGEGARGADPERHRGNHQEDRGAAARRRRLGRRRASDFAGDRIDPAGVRQRQWRGRRAKPDHRRNVRQCRLRLALHRLGRRKRHRDRRRDQASRSAWRKRRQSRPGGHDLRAETQIALRGAAAPERAPGPAQTGKTALQPQDRNPDPARPDNSTGLRDFDRRHFDQRRGRREADAKPKPRRHAAGHRRLQNSHRRAFQGRRAGAVRAAGCGVARGDRRQIVGDPRREHRIRHPRHGSRCGADEDFRAGRRQRRDLDRRHVRHQLCRNAGSNPVQYRTKILDWADRALPPFQEAFLARTSAWRSAP